MLLFGVPTSGSPNLSNLVPTDKGVETFVIFGDDAPLYFLF